MEYMAQSSRAPQIEYARPGANPTLETIELIRAALRESEAPLSRNSILIRLSSWGHSTSRPTLNAALGFLGDEGHTIEGSKGIVWVSDASVKLRAEIQKGHPL